MTRVALRPKSYGIGEGVEKYDLRLMVDGGPSEAKGLLGEGAMRLAQEDARCAPTVIVVAPRDGVGGAAAAPPSTLGRPW